MYTSKEQRGGCSVYSLSFSRLILKKKATDPRCWIKWQLSSLTCNKVAALEGLFKLLWVFVLAIPDWVPLTVKVLPEVGDGYCQGVLVGILSLELVHDKCTKEKRGDGWGLIDLSVQTKKIRWQEKQQWTIAVCHLKAYIIGVKKVINSHVLQKTYRT